MKIFYKKIVEANEMRVPGILANINQDEDSIFYKGYEDGNGLSEQYAALSCLMNLTASYFNEDNLYYKSKEVMNAINGFIDFHNNVIREDGSGDCLISDFYTPSSFDAIRVAKAYYIFEKYSKTDEELETKKRIYDLLNLMGNGLINSGFRTPNHRWMIAAAASMIANIANRSDLRDLATAYLKEGIDIDEYGEFTERSPGMYNEVNDRALFVIAKELDRPDIYEHLRSNMDLLFKYMEPDGSIFTQNSARKDKGENDPSMGFFPTRYFAIYLEGALVFNSKKYASFAKHVMEETIKYSRAIPDCLWFYMLYPEAKEYDPETEPQIKKYEMYNPTSSIYRFCDDDFSVSVVGNNSNFLFIQKGDLKCYFRLCASFFMAFQFKPEKVEKIGNDIFLEYSFTDYYKKPLENVDNKTSVYKELDHKSRKTCNHQTLTFKVKITIIKDVVDVNIVSSGTDRVPMKFEICTLAGADIIGESFTAKAIAGQYIFPHKGDVVIKQRKNKMKIGEAFHKHTYGTNMRGSVPKSSKGYTIYFTEFTNISKNIRIECY